MKIHSFKLTDLAKKVYLVQQENKCLVVLDDIWSIETWESLKAEEYGA